MAPPREPQQEVSEGHNNSSETIMSLELDRTLSHLHGTLESLEAGRITADVVCARFRVASLQWPGGLPQRYEDVLERLLQPLDTAVMLGTESCSFSRQDVVAALHQWLDHAAQLQAVVASSRY
jgi:hypothetical protein